MSQASVTDWIQALAVLGALALAVWELQLSERRSRVEQVTYTLALIEGSNEAALAEAVALLRSVAQEKEKPEVEAVAEANVRVTRHLFQWSFCYETKLCATDIAQVYACPDMRYLHLVQSNLRKNVASPYYWVTATDDPYDIWSGALWEACKLKDG